MTGDLLFAGRDRIEAAQEANFAETMDLVCRGHPYYRALLAGLGLGRGDFRSLADLPKLPVTAKEAYMAEPERFRLRLDDLPDEMRVVWDVMYTTGSTSGRPTPFVSTTFDFFGILEVNHAMMRLRGVTAGDRIANLFPLTVHPHGAFIRALHAASVYGVPVVSTLPGNPSPYFRHGNETDEVVRIVERHRSTILWGVPSYLRRVLERAAELRADFAAVRLVFATGEGLPEAARADLVERLEALGAADPAVSISYGATEMQGGMVECRPGAGYHNPAPDQFFIEIVDPDTHEPQPDGAEGMILLTHLRRRGTVLLRYALGDLTVRSRETCRWCGANTDRLVARPRRADSLVKVKGTLVNPAAMAEAVAGEPGIGDFVLEVDRKDPAAPLSGDVLTLRVAAPRDEALAARLARVVKRASGVTPTVVFEAAGTLAGRGDGWKSKRFVDRRPRSE